jgi:hypothetical protein
MYCLRFVFVSVRTIKRHHHHFGTHEKQIIADHDPVQLVVKLTANHMVEWNDKLEFFPDKPGWTPTKWMTTVTTTWLPFGYMCLHNIAAKYIDTGVTDAITKHDAYVASKTFTTAFLRARRNPLPKMSLLPWMICPPLCASKIIIVKLQFSKRNWLREAVSGTNQSVRLSSTKPMLSWLVSGMPRTRRIRKNK